MGHLLFRPRPAGGPQFFLWGRESDSASAAILERLAALGRHATAQVVTDHGRVERVPGFGISPLDGVAVLAGLGTADLDRIPASVVAWTLAAKLALDLVARERVLPLAYHDRAETEARWGVSLSIPKDAGRFARLARAFPPSAHAVPVRGETTRHPVAAVPRVERIRRAFGSGRPRHSSLSSWMRPRTRWSGRRRLGSRCLWPPESEAGGKGDSSPR